MKTSGESFPKTSKNLPEAVHIHPGAPRATPKEGTLNDHEKLPADLTPLNLQAYLYNAWGVCGCSETDEMVKSLQRLLEWMEGDKSTRYDALYPEIGTFYLLAGRLDSLGLTEHGTSIRYPWLTDEGKRLLSALQSTTPEAIEEAQGEAYDGCTYGMC